MGARGRKRARSMERRAHERQGRLATEIALTSRQAIPARSKQKKIAARGMPAAVRTRSNFDSSMAAEKPWSPRRAAAVSWSNADNPRKYIYGTTTLWIVGAPKRPAMRQNAAEPHQNEARLVDANSPEDLQCLIAGILAERSFGGCIQGIDETAVIFLREVMHRAANQKMDVEFTTQFA